ncbi:hypothetical protein LWI28_021188 [Acer negundo]|uniref:Uncharacterized protein n=1 Tax=Acer negundo TaxID=4023 RepID=A0AAD5IGI9_ACENE|nr:hypothetical protein LWI28_021188 [Acer negundo]
MDAIVDIREIMKRIRKISVIYVPKGGNVSTDLLANLGSLSGLNQEAGIFRDAGTPVATNMEVEEGDEGSGGGGGAGGGGSSSRREDTVEISSENSGPARSRSDDEFDGGENDDDDGGGDKNKKKRKKYHRHTAEQIREMEALFKESPHPDEKQRQQLSKQLGLAPRQVKFWFQNRRTQIKAIQERHENSLLKTEMEKLRDDNKAMRETINKSCCPNCGTATTSRTLPSLLRNNNYVSKMPNSKPRLDKSRITELVNQGMEELQKMATAGDPLWVRSVETGREILNYDEYVKEFSVENSSSGKPKRSIEASRDTGVVFVDLPKLVQSFMDVNQWKAMFPCLISKAATVDVICSGDGPNRDGAVQLMFAEMQMLTPLVPTREVYFVRYCKQISAEQWAIVDVSIDKVEENIDAL